mmetsp:Transcript_854/g.3540  ORF Transcript_854/g.3540 Transcript_854/m.3540 type:complete len:244 (-) Transcript_854:3752-4483(-)
MTRVIIMRGVAIAREGDNPHNRFERLVSDARILLHVPEHEASLLGHQGEHFVGRNEQAQVYVLSIRAGFVQEASQSARHGGESIAGILKWLGLHVEAEVDVEEDLRRQERRQNLEVHLFVVDALEHVQQVSVQDASVLDVVLLHRDGAPSVQHGEKLPSKGRSEARLSGPDPRQVVRILRRQSTYVAFVPRPVSPRVSFGRLLGEPIGVAAHVGHVLLKSHNEPHDVKRDVSRRRRESTGVEL